MYVLSSLFHAILSPSHRYLFYSHSISRISRLWLNGKNEELLFIDLSNPFNDIVGLEVDLNRNRLYWTQENNKGIRYLELNTLEQDVDSVS